MAGGGCLQINHDLFIIQMNLRPPCASLSFVQKSNLVLLGSRRNRFVSTKTSLESNGKIDHQKALRKFGQTKVYAQSRFYPSSDGEETDGGGRSPWSPRDEYGLYPWDPSWQSAESSDADWEQDDIITLFTNDGLVCIGGSMRPSSSKRKQSRQRALNRQRRYREEDYMDPNQGLCLGAIFDIAATNGLDKGRRIYVLGFCRSIEMLNDVVQDTVLDLGGEVVIADKGTTGGLHEKLSMTVAMPLLWGVPPAVDALHHAIRSGGGIVEKVYRQWEFL